MNSWGKIFNRIAVLNSKISKKRKRITDRTQLVEKKPKWFGSTGLTKVIAQRVPFRRQRALLRGQR